MFTRETIESALDRGVLFAETNGRRWLRLRRNGRTQTWKTRPNDFRIPVKAGLRSTAQITHDNMNSGTLRIQEE